MADERRSKIYLRRLIIGAGLALPTLSLIPFGSYWLWQNGYLLYWAIAAAAMTGAAYLYQSRLLALPAGAMKTTSPGDEPHEAWSPKEELAWRSVLQLAQSVDPDAIQGRDDVIGLGLKTVDTVARSLHPEVEDPLWQFTVPEALAVVEQVSGRLRPLIVDNVPLGDRLTVAQLLGMYRWRGAVDVASRAYDIWRVLRIVNPVAAATQEARERLTKYMVDWGKDQVTKKIAEAYLKEVGRAAIDLYGGRLRVITEPERPSPGDGKHGTGSHQAMVAMVPLRCTIVGNDEAVLTRLLHALAIESRFYATGQVGRHGQMTVEVERDDVTGRIQLDMAVIEAPSTKKTKQVLEGVSLSDVLVIVLSGENDVLQNAKMFLADFRTYFSRQLHLAPPPIVVVLMGNMASVIDGVQMKHISVELDVPLQSIVHAGADNTLTPGDTNGIWQLLRQTMPAGRRVQLLRLLAENKTRGRWGRMFKQVSNAGRAIADGAIGSRQK